MTAWVEYWRDEMNVPGKTDHYLMQLTEQIRWSKSDGSVPFDSNRQRIQFVNARQFFTGQSVEDSFKGKEHHDLTEEQLRKKHREQVKMLVGSMGGAGVVKGSVEVLQKVAEMEARDGQRN